MNRKLPVTPIRAGMAPVLLPEVAPARGHQSAWEGTVQPKPWDYRVTAAIPVIDHPELLALVIELLRHQTERPYILVIDTGSKPENLAKIQAMRAADVEVHSIRSHAWRHPSEPVTAAMDLATAMCHTPFLFCTHADCFLMRRDVLAEMVELTAKYKAVGYQITERHDPDWLYALGHTCTMLDMATADAIGLQWSMRRYYAAVGRTWGTNPHTGGWPDTESLFNAQLVAAGIRPCIIGTERNHQRNRDGTIDHCRSVPSASLYSPFHQQKMAADLADAVATARARLREWQLLPPPPPAPISPPTITR